MNVDVQSGYKKNRKKILSQIKAVRIRDEKAYARKDTDTVMKLGMRIWELQMQLVKLRKPTKKKAVTS